MSEQNIELTNVKHESVKNVSVQKNTKILRGSKEQTI